MQYIVVPEDEVDERCILTPDTCVIDGEHFFVRGCIDIPLVGCDEPFTWGVWTSLSEENFLHFQELLNVPKRSDHGPFFGWLASYIWIYPDTMNLKTMVHLRDNGICPYVELEPTDHPLAVEQRGGITLERLAEIVEMVMHPRRG